MAAGELQLTLRVLHIDVEASTCVAEYVQSIEGADGKQIPIGGQNIVVPWKVLSKWPMDDLCCAVNEWAQENGHKAVKCCGGK